MRWFGLIALSLPLKAALAAICVPVFLLIPGAASHAARYAVTPGEPNLVRFESKAPVESFDGKTREVSGHVVCNPENLSDSVEVRFEVDLASLDTGIGLRNQHMRENHLETEKYPKAVFRGGKVIEPSAPALAPGKTVTFRVEGEFALHGVQKTIQIPCEVTLVPGQDGNALHILARFPVKLPDYKIDRPQFLVMRLDETQKVTVDLHAVETP